MRFFADRIRDRPASETDPSEPPGARTGGLATLASTLHDLASSIARGCGDAAPPVSLATILTALWSKAHTFDAADPTWPDRDRFVLSHPAGTPLLYGLLHLTGHSGMERATLDHCGELDAIATGAAEYGRHPAVEVSTAPAGQAIAAAAGMAVAERLMAARFGKSLVDHRIWTVARADELTHGVCDQAAAFAGLMRLDRFVLLVDATAQEAEDARTRYTAYGWAVKSVHADDVAEIDGALSSAMRSRKPTLVWCAASTRPHRAGGAPDAVEAWRRIGSRGSTARRGWLKRITRHPQRAEFERVIAGRLPDGWHEPLNALRHQLVSTKTHVSPAALCRQSLVRLSPSMPELLCGQLAEGGLDPVAEADLAQSGSRVINYGNRAHAMAACLNGISLHAGTLPVATASLPDVAEQLPALRLAALLGRRVVHLVTDPGLAVAGRAWRPAGLLPALRAIPGLHVFRPGCLLEAAECMELALRRSDGPSILIVGNDRCGPLRADTPENRCARGGYVVAEAVGSREATLIATGPEVALALAAQSALAGRGLAVAVVSLPCWALFAVQDQSYRRSVLGDAPRFGIEAAGRDGWDRWLGEGGTFIGGDISTCGPADAIRHRLGLTSRLVTDAVLRQLGWTNAGVPLTADFASV